MVSQLKRSSQNNVARHLVHPSDTGVLGGDITVSNYTLTKAFKITNVQKSSNCWKTLRSEKLDQH